MGKMNNKKEPVDFPSVVKRIYVACSEKVKFEFTDAANKILEKLHDEVIDYLAPNG